MANNGNSSPLSDLDGRVVRTAERTFNRLFESGLDEAGRARFLRSLTSRAGMSGISDAVIDELARRGPVTRLDELTEVSGIGPRRLIQLTEILADAGRGGGSPGVVAAGTDGDRAMQNVTIDFSRRRSRRLTKPRHNT